MNKLSQIILLNSSLCLLLFSLNATGETVGQILSRIQAKDRGHNEKLDKSRMSLPAIEAYEGSVKQKVDYNAIKPPKGADLMDSSLDGDRAKLEKLTDQQISELFRMTKKFAKSTQRGEIWLRLAELYVEKSKLIELRQQEEYEKKLQAFNEGRSKVRPQIQLKAAKEYNKKAITLYEYFAKDFPNDPKMDQALFFLGFNYFELGDVKKGSAYYTRLVKEYPKSIYLDEAYFALGDYYFENDRWSQAHENYSKVIARKSARLFQLALYKSSWSLFRMGRTQEALSRLTKLIEMGKAESNAESKKKTSWSRLENEALRDIVLFYADAAPAVKAVNFFNKLLGENDFHSLERLAYYYADKGEKEEAAIIFRHLIDRDPNAEKAFDYQQQIVQGQMNVANAKNFKKDMENWAKKFSPGSEWYEANKKNEGKILRSQKVIESTLRSYILQNHQSAQNSRADYSRKRALDGYALYFSSFPASNYSADMHFFHAELLFDMERYSEATKEYQWIIDNQPKSKYASQAAMSFVLAAEKSLPAEAEMVKRIAGSSEPVSLDSRVESFIKSAKWYLENYPEAEKRIEVKFKMGRLYYLSNHFTEAEQIFKEIVQSAPKSRQATFSANLLLDIYNIKKDYVGLEKAGKELLANPGLANSEAVSDVKGVLEKAGFRSAVELATKKDYRGSAEQFERFAKENPKSELVATAWYNSGINYEKAGLLAQAMASYRQVLSTKDPKAESKKEDSEMFLANLYRETGDLLSAARAYEKIYLRYGKADAKGRVPLYNSGMLYYYLGYNQKAVALLSQYQPLAKSSERVEIMEALAKAYKNLNRKDQAITTYKDLVSASTDKAEKVRYMFELAEMYDQRGLDKEATKWQNSLLQLQRSIAPRGSSYAAKIKIKRAEAAFEDYRKIVLVADPKKQMQAATQKRTMLEKLEKELGDIIKLDSGEEIISALAMIGKAHYHLYQTILNAPIQKGIEGEDLVKTKEALKAAATPYLDKSMNAYRTAVSRGQDLQIYSESYKKAFAALRELGEQTVYDNGEKASGSSYLDWMGL